MVLTILTLSTHFYCYYTFGFINVFYIDRRLCRWFNNNVRHRHLYEKVFDQNLLKYLQELKCKLENIFVPNIDFIF